MPDVLLVGMALLPVVYAGFFVGNSIIIHESDSVPSNKLAAPFAKNSTGF